MPTNPSEPVEPADAAENDETAAAEAPLNRAERRARGRGKTAAAQPTARGKVVGSHGPANAQRNWANRRSG
jgi:hypothetical protein